MQLQAIYERKFRITFLIYFLIFAFYFLTFSGERKRKNKRIKRRVCLMKHAEQLGYMSPTNQQEMLYLKSKWESLKDHLVS